ncbi:hypothetical protein [Phenylobacterium sp.]|jgi:hypothetical protein|uniref:hypothetical protein n=1 Tax=Phenylobacterium sp. TaxID=1871053 RepID=UPI002F3F24AC
MLHLDATDPGPFLGVAIGAVLATMGGLVGGQIENRLNRKEREKSAALLFGEILAGLRLITRMASDSRGRGEPYGRVTLRIVQAALRETQVYDRNRETLFSVRDPDLRARTHLLLAQMSLTLESVLEAASAIRAADEARATGEASDHAAERRAAAESERAGSFDFMLELAAELPPLIVRYEALAGQSFDATDLALRGAVVTPSAAA